MKGQWLGLYEGEYSGHTMINVDEVDGHFEGVAYLHPLDRKSPATIGYFTTESTNPTNTVEVITVPIDPRTGFQGTWEMLSEFYPSYSHSKKATATFEVKGDELTVNAETDIGTKISGTFSRPADNSKTKIKASAMSWAQYKEYVSTISKVNYFFRGQQQPWPLCTSFHRRGRYRISEFTNKDVKQLHKRLSAITRHFFDLNVPDQNGAFINLLQHHGYPTPLLDWSLSPFVAAFFAFRDRPFGGEGTGSVRIYLFDNRAWQNIYPQIAHIDPAFAHLSVLDFIAIDNPRMVPQQAVTTTTNVHDIEAYILQKEIDSGKTFLTAIDIPANEREKAMSDLRFMGITAGSMFPSIDGICEELKERNFEI